MIYYISQKYWDHTRKKRAPEPYFAEIDIKKMFTVKELQFNKMVRFHHRV